MNIDELTLGQIKQLQAVVGCADGKKPTLVLEKKRVVMVVDRGWIFAGDQSVTSDGYIRLDNAVHVFGWQSIGFAKVVKDWKSDKVDVRPCDPVELPQDAVIFRIPVAEGWGIK